MAERGDSRQAGAALAKLRRHLRARWEAGDRELFWKPCSRGGNVKAPAPPPRKARPATPARPAPEKMEDRHPSGLLSPRASERGKALLDFYDKIRGCTRCSLGARRKNFVFGMGNPEAKIVFAGEAPGEQEDLQGLPFVGPAGQLLTRILASFGINRDDVFICNVLKCRPPNNRNPSPEEMDECLPYLLEQVRIISPRFVVALGRFAAQCLLKTGKPIGQLRGRVYKLNDADLIATYHPSAILRNPNNRPILDADLKRLTELMERQAGS